MLQQHLEQHSAWLCVCNRAGWVYDGLAHALQETPDFARLSGWLARLKEVQEAGIFAIDVDSNLALLHSKDLELEVNYSLEELEDRAQQSRATSEALGKLVTLHGAMDRRLQWRLLAAITATSETALAYAARWRQHANLAAAFNAELQVCPLCVFCAGVVRTMCALHFLSLIRRRSPLWKHFFAWCQYPQAPPPPLFAKLQEIPSKDIDPALLILNWHSVWCGPALCKFQASWRSPPGKLWRRF